MSVALGLEWAVNVFGVTTGAISIAGFAQSNMPHKNPTVSYSSVRIAVGL